MAGLTASKSVNGNRRSTQHLEYRDECLRGSMVLLLHMVWTVFSHQTNVTKSRLCRSETSDTSQGCSYR